MFSHQVPIDQSLFALSAICPPCSRFAVRSARERWNRRGRS